MVLPVRPGGFEQRAQADLVRTLRQHLQSELGDDAVLADQRHDVGERADRRDLHERRQPRRLPRPRAERLHQLQRDADAGEVLVRIAAVVSLRIHHRARIGQLVVRFVMVGDDQVDAELAGAARRFRRADAAVDRDDQLHAFGVEAIDGARLQTVAVGQPFGNEVADVGAEQLERAPQNHGGRDAVDVVVAVDGNALATADRQQQPIGRAFEAGEPERIVELIERRVQEPRRLVGVGDAANRQQPRRHRRHAERLRQRCRRGLVVRFRIPDRRNCQS